MTVQDAQLACPLCGWMTNAAYHEDGRREYRQCERCELVFVEPQWRLSAMAERAEYELHENSAEDVGYRRFLGRVADPLCGRLRSGAKGLDFGCGPGPALPVMMTERGFGVALYDPFFFPDATVFSRQFDFVTATEVVEHLHAPGRELHRLWGLLRSGGWLGIMTKRVRTREAFANWHYKNDPTHVAFFSERSFRWLAERLGAELDLIGADVALLRKP